MRRETRTLGDGQTQTLAGGTGLGGGLGSLRVRFLTHGCGGWVGRIGPVGPTLQSLENQPRQTV